MIAFIKNVIAQRKQAQAKAVVDTYLDGLGEVIQDVLPMTIESYRAIAHVAIDKTLEKPELVEQALTTLYALVDHYGPDLRRVYEQHMDNVVAVSEERSRSISERLNAAIKAFKE